MAGKSRVRQGYRHTPAYILIFLARENLYGSALLKSMEKDMPHCQTDSASIYRSLQELEKEGSVEYYWETDTVGPARKWYKITEKGWEKLAELKNDITMRKENFDYFLAVYKGLQNDEVNKLK